MTFKEEDGTFSTEIELDPKSIEKSNHCNTEEIFDLTEGLSVQFCMRGQEFNSSAADIIEALIAHDCDGPNQPSLQQTLEHFFDKVFRRGFDLGRESAKK